MSDIYQSDKKPIWAVHTQSINMPTVIYVGTSIWISTYYINNRLVHRYGPVRRIMLSGIYQPAQYIELWSILFINADYNCYRGHKAHNNKKRLHRP